MREDDRHRGMPLAPSPHGGSHGPVTQGGGIPEWFGKDAEPPPPPRRGGSPKFAIAAAVLLMGAGVGAFVVTRGHDQDARDRAAAAERELEQARQTENELKRRLEAEMKAAAEATPEPVEPDPSELPSIEDVLAEGDDDAGADDADESDAAPGQRDAAQVLTVINGLRKDVRRCFETELQTNPTAGGRVDVTLTIAPSGRVSAATAKSTGTLSEVATNCIVRTTRTARFAPASDTATVKVPFAFNAQ